MFGINFPANIFRIGNVCKIGCDTAGSGLGERTCDPVDAGGVFVARKRKKIGRATFKLCYIE